MEGTSEAREFRVAHGRLRPLHFGMHVIDAHEQHIGTVVLVREDHFVMRQELGMNQLVALPMVAVSGVIGGMVFLNMTPGEVEMYGRTLERRERSSAQFKLRSRSVRTRLATDPA